MPRPFNPTWKGPTPNMFRAYPPTSPTTKRNSINFPNNWHTFPCRENLWIHIYRYGRTQKWPIRLCNFQKGRTGPGSQEQITPLSIKKYQLILANMNQNSKMRPFHKTWMMNQDWTLLKSKGESYVESEAIQMYPITGQFSLSLMGHHSPRYQAEISWEKFGHLYIA